ncbi:tail fiber domain-containing protein [Leifsonia virtsii]|uniref:Tail fiber domain-containing protein n=1 Tax=Leifsonia virtsii TaxID=3035915 RepID=A0ABT8J186_9MICO|nr:tail fiber domain-containing protein [Leifsonia virtsii]MDN4598841.1 tail fiber domain-containing protein [Leifsonia virtsii]
MANGDLAASIGLAVFPGTQDRRQGYDNDNIRGDELAKHIIDGGHDFSHITGTLSADQVPALDASKITTGVLDADRLGLTAAKIPALPPSKIAPGNFGAGIGMITNQPIATTSTMNAGAGLGIGGTGQGFDSAGNIGCGAITSPYTRANPVADWVALGVSSGGRIGPQASARRFKQNIKPWLISIDTFMGLEPKTFRYKAAVKEHGQSAPYEVGFIADDFAAAGLDALVYLSDDGQLGGIHYERLVVPLWGIVQQQQQLIDALSERVATLEGQTNG